MNVPSIMEDVSTAVQTLVVPMNALVTLASSCNLMA